MKTTIKVNSINHAVICIFEENLLAEFEHDYGEICDGSNLEEHCKKYKLSVGELVDFLNRNSSNHYEVA